MMSVNSGFSGREVNDLGGDNLKDWETLDLTGAVIEGDTMTLTVPVSETATFLRIIGVLKRLLVKRPADAQTILNLIETAQKMFEAEEKVRDAQRARDIEEREVEKWEAAIERIRQKIKASGCRG